MLHNILTKGFSRIIPIFLVSLLSFASVVFAGGSAIQLQSSGSLTDSDVLVGADAVEVGRFEFHTTEMLGLDMRVTDLNFDVNGVHADTDFDAVWLEDVLTGNMISSHEDVSSSEVDFNIDLLVPSGETVYFSVYADISDSANVGNTFAFDLDATSIGFEDENGDSFWSLWSEPPLSGPTFTISEEVDADVDSGISDGTIVISPHSSSPGRQTVSSGTTNHVFGVAGVEVTEDIHVEGIRVYLDAFIKEVDGVPMTEDLCHDDLLMKTTVRDKIHAVGVHLGSASVTPATGYLLDYMQRGQFRDGGCYIYDSYYDFDTDFYLFDSVNVFTLDAHLSDDAVNGEVYSLSLDNWPANWFDAKYFATGVTVPESNILGYLQGQDQEINDFSDGTIVIDRHVTSPLSQHVDSTLDDHVFAVADIEVTEAVEIKEMRVHLDAFFTEIEETMCVNNLAMKGYLRTKIDDVKVWVGSELVTTSHDIFNYVQVGQFQDEGCHVYDSYYVFDDAFILPSGHNVVTLTADLDDASEGDVYSLSIDNWPSTWLEVEYVSSGDDVPESNISGYVQGQNQTVVFDEEITTSEEFMLRDIFEPHFREMIDGLYAREIEEMGSRDVRGSFDTNLEEWVTLFLDPTGRSDTNVEQNITVYKYTDKASAVHAMDLLVGASRHHDYYANINGVGEQAFCYAYLNPTRDGGYIGQCTMRYDNILFILNFSYSDLETFDSSLLMRFKFTHIMKNQLQVFEGILYDLLGNGKRVGTPGIASIEINLDRDLPAVDEVDESRSTDSEPHVDTRVEPTVDATIIPLAGFEEEVITNEHTSHYESPFKDINVVDTLEEIAAVKLYELGIIGGFPDGTFRGDNPVNRAEAAKFLLLSKYEEIYEVENNGYFWDVKNGEWYTKYVMTAAGLRVINGYSDGSFRPADTVNTVEFLKMLTLTFGLETHLAHPYKDVDHDSWYAQYLGVAYKYELFPHRRFDRILPASELTRGEVAVAIYQYFLNR